MFSGTRGPVTVAAAAVGAVYLAVFTVAWVLPASSVLRRSSGVVPVCTVKFDEQEVRRKSSLTVCMSSFRRPALRHSWPSPPVVSQRFRRCCMQIHEENEENGWHTAAIALPRPQLGARFGCEVNRSAQPAGAQSPARGGVGQQGGGRRRHRQALGPGHRGQAARVLAAFGARRAPLHNSRCGADAGYQCSGRRRVPSQTPPLPHEPV